MLIRWPRLIKTRNSSKYLIAYSKDFMRPLVVIIFKMSGHVKDRDGDKDKNVNNR